MIFIYNKILSVYIYIYIFNNADAIKFLSTCTCLSIVVPDEEFMNLSLTTPLLLYMPDISLINQTWNNYFIRCTTSSVLLRKSTFD